MTMSDLNQKIFPCFSTNHLQSQRANLMTTPCLDFLIHAPTCKAGTMVQHGPVCGPPAPPCLDVLSCRNQGKHIEEPKHVIKRRRVLQVAQRAWAHVRSQQRVWMKWLADS